MAGQAGHAHARTYTHPYTPTTNAQNQGGGDRQLISGRWSFESKQHSVATRSKVHSADSSLMPLDAVLAWGMHSTTRCEAWLVFDFRTGGPVFTISELGTLAPVHGVSGRL